MQTDNKLPDSRILLNLVTAVVIALCVSGPKHTHADVTDCNGVWQSKPCSIGTSSTAVTTVDATQKAAEPVASRSIPDKDLKRSLFHDLTMKNVRARREFDIRIDLRPIEKFCFEQESSLEDCRQLINETDDRLTDRIHQAETLRVQQKAVEGTAQVAEPGSGGASNSTSVSIDESRVVEIINAPLGHGTVVVPVRPRDDDHHHHPYHPPHQPPGHSCSGVRPPQGTSSIQPGQFVLPGTSPKVVTTPPPVRIR